MWCDGTNYRGVSRPGLELALSASCIPFCHDINFPVINKPIGGERRQLGIRGTITAVLCYSVLRSWETAGEEERSDHMWELVRELSQVQWSRASLVYFSQAQSAVESLCLCYSSPEVIGWEEHVRFRQRGRVDGRERPREWWAIEEAWLPLSTEISIQLLSCH